MSRELRADGTAPCYPFVTRCSWLTVFFLLLVSYSLFLVPCNLYLNCSFEHQFSGTAQPDIFKIVFAGFVKFNGKFAAQRCNFDPVKTCFVMRKYECRRRDAGTA